MDLKVLSEIDYGVGVSSGVLFRVPDETKAHYSELGFDLGTRHGSNLRDRHRKPDPQRVRRARLHDTRGASANLGLAAPGRFHVLAGRARHPAPTPRYPNLDAWVRRFQSQPAYLAAIARGGAYALVE